MNNLRALILLFGCLPVFVAASTDSLIDPTRPNGSSFANAGATGAGGWRLSATRITPVQRSAVINGSRVREGEEINGARVLHIRHAQVQIATPGGVTTLQLLPAEVKKIP